MAFLFVKIFILKIVLKVLPPFLFLPERAIGGGMGLCANKDYEDNLIGSIRSIMWSIDSQWSNLHNFQGEGGIGKFTLIYYKLTTKPTSYVSVDNPTTINMHTHTHTATYNS